MVIAFEAIKTVPIKPIKLVISSYDLLEKTLTLTNLFLKVVGIGCAHPWYSSEWPLNFLHILWRNEKEYINKFVVVPSEFFVAYSHIIF